MVYTRTNPDVAYNEQDHDYYVVWQYQDGTYMRIRGKPFDPTGPTYGSMQLSTGAALKNCYEPAIAYASSAHSFIVVWERHVTSSLASDIEAQILTGGGSFDGNNFFIKQGAINNSHSQPDVAYNRSRNEYLVAWTQRIATGPIRCHPDGSSRTMACSLATIYSSGGPRNPTDGPGSSGDANGSQLWWVSSRLGIRL